MLVTYAAPNRAHHYPYAAALARAGCLHRFVSGFPRFSPRARLPEVGDKLLRADHLQNVYIASMKLRLPSAISDELAHLSKIWIDHCSEKPARASDIFLFYGGCGLRTTTRLRSTATLCVAEEVTSHVLVQERIMREEHRRLGLPFRPFHPRETARRVKEYERADAIICASRFSKASFIDEGIPGERVFIVPYGMPLPGTATRQPRNQKPFRVLYVGQISVRKGVRYLFEAFQQLQHPAKELWIVGPQAKQTGIEGVTPPEQTRFLGALKGDALAQAYQNSSVLVLPSVEDGFGLVLGEALSFGLPVITTVNSGGADLFQDGREGFTVPIRDPRAIAEKLQVLADDPSRYEAMSVAAQICAKNLGGWETSDRLLVETLTSIARKGRCGTN